MAVTAIVAVMFCKLAPMAAQQDSLFRIYGPMLEVDALIRRDFVGPVTDDKLVEGAIAGMMRRLDPYSHYLSPAQLEAYRRMTSSRHSGVGIEVGLVRGQSAVIAPVEGGPASAAGVRAGDLIVAVDGRSTKNMSVLELDCLLAGPPGSVTSLTLLRPATNETLTATIERAEITVPTVKGFARTGSGWSWMIDSAARIGYVRVVFFGDHTTTELAQALDGLRAAGARGLILDLRFNPGGRVDRAAALVDRFVADGMIVTTVTRLGAQQQFPSTADGTDTVMKLAVLVNNATASAAEIVSGSLQDHGRATIVGERTFGKGSVQQFFDLDDGRRAVRLTTAHYRLPISGRIIHRTSQNAATTAWGVIPDVMVELTSDEMMRITSNRETVDRGASASLDVRGSEDDVPMVDAPVIKIDRQLAAALDSLRRQLDEM